MLLSIATAVASSDGFEVVRVGKAISSVVKVKDVLSLIPANELLELSSKADASIFR